LAGAGVRTATLPMKGGSEDGKVPHREEEDKEHGKNDGDEDEVHHMFPLFQPVEFFAAKLAVC
jgi:hypothetical protein